METDLDFASEHEEKMRQKALQEALDKAKNTPKLQPTGECLNPLCGDELENEKALFCPGGQCAREYEQYSDKQAESGRRTLRI